MSQSDYIKYKRVSVELKNQSENLTPVIGSGQYINYKAFTLENTIISSKIDYMKLQPSSGVNVFGMQKNNPTSCTNFKICSGTNSRVNRKPLLGVQSNAHPLTIPNKTIDYSKSICNHFRIFKHKDCY